MNMDNNIESTDKDDPEHEPDNSSNKNDVCTFEKFEGVESVVKKPDDNLSNEKSNFNETFDTDLASCVKSRHIEEKDTPNDEPAISYEEEKNPPGFSDTSCIENLISSNENADTNSNEDIFSDEVPTTNQPNAIEPHTVAVQCLLDEECADSPLETFNLICPLNAVVSEVQLSTVTSHFVGSCIPPTVIILDSINCRASGPIRSKETVSIDDDSEYSSRTLIKEDYHANSIADDSDVESGFNNPSISQVPLSEEDLYAAVISNRFDDAHCSVEQSGSDNVSENENDNLSCDKSDQEKEDSHLAENFVQLREFNMKDLCVETTRGDSCTDGLQLDEAASLVENVGPLEESYKSGSEGTIMVYGGDPLADVTLRAGCCRHIPRNEVASSASEIGNGSSYPHELAPIPESAEAEVKGDGPPKGDAIRDVGFEYGDKRRLSGRRKLKRLPSIGNFQCKKTTEVALLVEKHFKDIFVPFESVKAQLVRQSRDILLCRYQGQFHSFRQQFLVPATTLLMLLRSKYLEPVCVCGFNNFSQNTVDLCQNCAGWPLCYNRRLVVHLGELDEGLLKPGDFYVCIQESKTYLSEFPKGTNSVRGQHNVESYQRNIVPSAESTLSNFFETKPDSFGYQSVIANIKEVVNSTLPSRFSVADAECASGVYISIKYRPKNNPTSSDGVLERRIDESDLGILFTTMAWQESSGADVMISDEHLTNVLQHLLLSVERGIERLEWSGVTKPWSTLNDQKSSTTSRCCHGASTKDSSVQTSPENEICTKPAPDEVALENDKDDVSIRTNGETVQTTPNDCTAESIRGLLDEIVNGTLPSSTTNAKRVKKEPQSNDVILRLTSNSLENVEDEADDGYCEHTLVPPKTLNQVDPDLLHSELVILPGSRCLIGRSVIVVLSTALKNTPSLSASHLAQLFLYFSSIPKKEVVSRGFIVLVDASEATEEFWSILDEAFYLLDGIIPNAVDQVLVLWNNSHETTSLFPTSRLQFEVIKSKEILQNFIKKDQLLPKHGGTYSYDHHEWISFRKFLEPFIHGCRLSGRHLVNLLEELKGSRLPSSSALTLQMIEQQNKLFRQTFQDEQLRHLEEEGDTILQELQSYRTKSPQNADYSENLDRTTVLYDELKKAIDKLTKLADRRLARLEKCLQMRTFQEESSHVLSWLSRKGAESLEKHQSVADSLGAIKEQEEEFEKFYFLAMRQIERGNDLLEEVSMLGHEPSLPKIREESQSNSDDDSGVQELAASLKQQLGSFSEKLEGTRERIEDTAKCYQLMDKSYEWALEAMRFVSQMGVTNMNNTGSIAYHIRCLQEYLDDHVPVSDDTFQEILDLSVKLENEKLTEQCKVAKMRCLETVDLIQARLKSLHKVRQQMEVDSFRTPVWDGDDCVPTPRTTRSNSQPAAIWAPTSSSTPYSLCLGHHRRRSDSNALSSVPQSYGTPVGSYTSFPSSYYLTTKETQVLDYFIQEKEEQLLHRGLITEDLTCQGPVTSISKGVLDSRISQRESVSSVSSNTSSSSSSAGSNNQNKHATSVLRSSGRGTYTCNNTGGVNVRWSKRHTKRSQTWQLRDEALEKIKNEVREQNDLLRYERLHSPTESMSDKMLSSEADSSSSSDNSSKSVHSVSQPEPVKGPVPVNTHLLSPSPSDLTDTGGGGTCDASNDAEAKARKTLMLIMNEMIQTERDYVKSLAYIIENYMPELLREDIPQALRGQRNVVFGNIEKICEFHSQYFLSELEQYENAPFFAGQCFLKYEPQFYLYAMYNKNKPKCDALMIEYGNAFFRKKQLELGDKMDLASYLLKPVQRMGKYALLLKQLLKECPEREPEHQDLRASEEMVRFQLRHGNDLLAMDALRDCDVNVKEQGRLLRQDEFLVWQGRSRKCLRHVFLFEDLILFSKARRDPQRKGYEMYQYKHSIKTTDMGLTEQIGDSPSKFEIWFRKRKLNDTYVLQAPTPDVKAAWVHELSKLLWKQALRNREMRLAEMSSMGIGNKPCLDIKPSEDQINDRSISLQQLHRAPRFRNSFGMPPYDQKSCKRPHSIISVSSSSSSGSSQSSFTFYGTLNLGFEPGDSPRPLHRSLTQQSQCSTESGFCTDASTAGDSLVDSEQSRHKKAERSDSLLSSDSMSTSTSPSELNCSPCEENIIEESITTSM